MVRTHVDSGSELTYTYRTNYLAVSHYRSLSVYDTSSVYYCSQQSSTVVPWHDNGDEVRMDIGDIHIICLSIVPNS